MKKSFLFACAILMIYGCKKDIAPQPQPLSLDSLAKPDIAATSAISEYPASALKDTLRGDYNGTPLTLTKNKTWYLDGIVSISNTTITIEPGTIIVGLNARVTGKYPGALVITNNAKIFARGTADDPIIFTSKFMVDGKANTTPQPGDLGGLVLIGKAPFHNNYGYKKIIIGAGRDSMVTYDFGGHAENQSSGELNYVRIEYAGYVGDYNRITTNPLLCAAVGKATKIRHIECANSNTRAFHFYGGTVNASYLLAINYRRQAFAASNGYNGTLSYGIALPGPLFEIDPERENDKISIILTQTLDGDGIIPNPPLITHPKLDHFTVVGTPGFANNYSFSPYTYGILIDNCPFDISKSIVLGYKYGLTIYRFEGVRALRTGGDSKVTDNILCGGISAVTTTFNSTLDENGNKRNTYLYKTNNFSRLQQPFVIPGQPINLIPLSVSPANQGTTDGAGAFNEESIRTSNWGHLKPWFRLLY